MQHKKPIHENCPFTEEEETQAVHEESASSEDISQREVNLEILRELKALGGEYLVLRAK